MLLPIHPPDPSSSLLDAVVAAGFQPVPVTDIDDVIERTPEDGWAPAVIEVQRDLGAAVALAAKISDEARLPVLLVIDRTLTGEIASESGIADFILSPIDRTELRVRLSRLGAVPEVDASDVLNFRDLELNLATYQATVAGAPSDLTFMEYELLRFFVENPARVWSREQLLAKVWGYDYFGGSRTVDVHVRRLRAKLGEERSSWITTVRSVGYRFG
ncbi:MAG: response regulator transcription factor [bacterium]|nr:response regulator transcription factor [bacterium]